MYVEDKEYLYIHTLHTDFTSNSVKLRNPHNFYLRVPENRDMTVTAIWKKPMRIFFCRWFLTIYSYMLYHLVGSQTQYIGIQLVK